MSFQPTFTITNRMTQAITRIERRCFERHIVQVDCYQLLLWETQR